ncbi:MFS transporter [Geminicoccaceae bacterium 1502E]|nr:MFS transporter [Geminicoccaceae bacterium 1502E]
MAQATADTGAGLRPALALFPMLVLGLAGNMSFQALIPQFMELWDLSSSEVGWISGVTYVSYAVASPILSALTDRIDARRVVIAGSAASAVAGIGYALLADGFWSAMFWRLAAGAGIAGIYMPGLKALTDRTAGPRQGRWQSWYTAAYSVGIALSLLVTGLAAEWFGWRWAFALSGILPALGGLVTLLAVAPATPPGMAATGPLLDLRPVLRQPGSLAYILGYAGHCWELFGLRTWLVAFLVFAAAAGGSEVSHATVAVIATFIMLLGLPASVLGNELATRHERRRMLSLVMLLSACLGAGLGYAAALPFWLVVALATGYGAVVMLDSAALTVGTLSTAAIERRGATIAVQSSLGSLAALASPLASGFVLDHFGHASLAGWGAAFVVVAGGALFGAASVRLLPRPTCRLNA